MPRDDGPFCANAQRLPNAPKFAHRAKKAKEPLLVDEHQEIIGDLRGEVEKLKAKLVQRENESAQHLVEDARDVELGEHWKEEVVKNVEARTQLQRSLIDVDRGLSQWRAERAHALEVLGKWDGRSDAMPPRGWHSPRRSRREQLQSPAEWQDYLEQTEVSIRESLETRASLEARLEQNRTVGRELHAQLPQRVVNEDIRAFLEIIQRVQVLEVERLELDHSWEQQRSQLESRDDEIAVLREQLRLRVEHLQHQRGMLSEHQLEQLPRQDSILGNSLRGTAPLQRRGLIRVMQAWAPSSKDQFEELPFDEEYAEATGPLQQPSEAIDWRNVVVPLASQLRGAARLHAPSVAASASKPARDGLRDSPGLELPMVAGRGGRRLCLTPQPRSRTRSPQPGQPGSQRRAQSRERSYRPDSVEVNQHPQHLRIPMASKPHKEAQQEVDDQQRIIGDLHSEAEMLRAKLANRNRTKDTSDQPPPGESRDVSEHWQEEVVKGIEVQGQLQRSLIEVDRGLSQWRKERAWVLEVIDRWDEGSGAACQLEWLPPGLQPRTLAEWRDALGQVEEHIRETTETRTSVVARLERNRAAGRDLHAQLPQRVVNEDTRAFLEMVQRVRGLEVEHLQLDQCWQQRRTQLESKDQEIDVLREQLRVRMDHLQRQRELLSDEQQAQLPEPAGSVLDSTLGKGPLRPRARAKAIQAWIPSSKERREEAHQAPEEDRVGPSSAEAPAEATDVRRAAVPQPPLARGGARFQQPRQGSSLPGRRSPPMGGKGLPEPPGVRPTPYAPSARPLPPKAVAGTPGTGISAQAPVAGGRRAAYVANQSVATSATPEALGAPGPYQARGQTCPPPQPSAAPRPPPPRTSPHPRMEADCIAAKQHLMHLKHVMANGAKKPMADLFSAKADRELGPVAGEKIAPRVLPNGSGVAAPVPAAAAPAGGGGPGSLATGARAASRRRGDARVRARSEQVPSRMNRFGRLVVHAREQELASAPLQSFRF